MNYILMYEVSTLTPLQTQIVPANLLSCAVAYHQFAEHKIISISIYNGDTKGMKMFDNVNGLNIANVINTNGTKVNPGNKSTCFNCKRFGYSCHTLNMAILHDSVKPESFVCDEWELRTSV